MCKLCDQGIPQDHSNSRRNFLKASALACAAATAHSSNTASAQSGDLPQGVGNAGA